MRELLFEGEISWILDIIFARKQNNHRQSSENENDLDDYDIAQPGQ